MRSFAVYSFRGLRFSSTTLGPSREPAWVYPICPRQPGDTECGYYVMLYIAQGPYSESEIKSASSFPTNISITDRFFSPQSSPSPFEFLQQECLIRGGLGAYGGKILGSSSEYVQSNISRYFSDPQYYFQVNDHYVRNKLKVVLFPFLHRGQWTRITEPVGGRLSYKPPFHDINAPDLYIPLMAFGTYVVLAGLSLGLRGKFSPEALNWLFIKGLLGWFMQATLLKVTLFSLGSEEAPLLDIMAYAGYTFAGMCLAVFGRIVSACWRIRLHFFQNLSQARGTFFGTISDSNSWQFQDIFQFDA
ncbi:hypothetical protein K1719_034624 [Acacia pycnantha]|nr:hypothetical protein K1719_034624 [Acacia pycnantha]